MFWSHVEKFKQNILCKFFLPQLSSEGSAFFDGVGKQSRGRRRSGR
ncbi:unnamed protein product [Spirodela intermedia]|uniref:Uncharacterized protein n=1 Tax=Spirodela intermedia TaxID=51605 RepID=A0A7I8LJE3_SPIIN|nr:unnamed protein product [Spirodela intermedia]